MSVLRAICSLITYLVFLWACRQWNKDKAKRGELTLEQQLPASARKMTKADFREPGRATGAAGTAKQKPGPKRKADPGNSKAAVTRQTADSAKLKAGSSKPAPEPARQAVRSPVPSPPAAGKSASNARSTSGAVTAQQSALAGQSPRLRAGAVLEEGKVKDASVSKRKAKTATKVAGSREPGTAVRSGTAATSSKQEAGKLADMPQPSRAEQGNAGPASGRVVAGKTPGRLESRQEPAGSKEAGRAAEDPDKATSSGQPASSKEHPSSSERHRSRSRHRSSSRPAGKELPGRVSPDHGRRLTLRDFLDGGAQTADADRGLGVASKAEGLAEDGAAATVAQPSVREDSSRYGGLDSETQAACTKCLRSDI